MFQIQCLDSKIENSTSVLAKFCIEPLNKGQGVTVGNALRRVLLSDLPGLAIIGVKIIGVNHEFSTIPGLKEDVIEILLNLKQIVFKGTIKSPVVARLTFQGSGIITAKDIELSGNNIEVVDPNQYIASVNGSQSIEMEFLIEQGQNYSISEQFVNRLPAGFLAVDAIFMPVRKVNFFIETSHTVSFSTTESLILEIITDGSIMPIEAIQNASEILRNIFSCFNKVEKASLETVIVEEPETKNDFDNVMLEELELSVRSYNCLKRANIHTVTDLLSYSQDELLKFKNFGQKSADEVCESLQNRFGILMPKSKSRIN